MPDKTEKDKEIWRPLQILEEIELFIVPTYRTNSFGTKMNTKYITMVYGNLRQLDREIDTEKVMEIFEYEKLLVYEIGFILYKNEVGHINESLKNNLSQHPKYCSKAITLAVPLQALFLNFSLNVCLSKILNITKTLILSSTIVEEECTHKQKNQRQKNSRFKPIHDLHL